MTVKTLILYKQFQEQNKVTMIKDKRNKEPTILPHLNLAKTFLVRRRVPRPKECGKIGKPRFPQPDMTMMLHQSVKNR